jgi:flagellar biosynthesis chaperone FliJ
MAVSRALRRLLRIRDLEEEQCRLALESAVSELHGLEQALASMGERNRQGRRLIESSARSGELPDRLSGIEEIHTAARYAAVLVPRIAEVQLEVAALRQAFIMKRVERRQAETLIQETEAKDAIETGRRDQQGLDDWYRNRMHREEQMAKSAEIAHANSEENSHRPLPAELERDSAETQD